MGTKIQLRRGLKADLPTLDNGEMAYCIDTKELFIGTSTGNELVIPKLTPQSDSTAIDISGLKADFNALLAKLRVAKLM